MRKMIQFFIERPVIVNLMTVIAMIVGITAVVTMKKEMFPAVDFDVVLIRTSYPGSSSEDVERLVSVKLEKKIKEVDGIKKMNALSSEGSSIIYIEVDPDYDLKEVFDDVKIRIDSVDDLPEDVDPPIMTSLTNREQGIMKVTLYGGASQELMKSSKKLRDYLERGCRRWPRLNSRAIRSRILK